MKRLYIRVAASALLATALIAGPSFAEAQAAAPAGLTDSSQLPGPALVSGTILDAAGKPASNVDVTLLVWPGDSAENMVAGDSLKLQPAAFTYTDPSGKYSLKVISATDLQTYVTRGGAVNFELVVTKGTVSKQYAFSLTVEDIVTALNTGQLPPAINLTLSSAAGVPSDPTATASDTTAPVNKACSSTLLVNYGQKPVLVGQGYIPSNATGVTQTFKYSNTATSSLGVATSSTNKAGSWSAGGTINKSATGEVSYGTYAANTYYDTYFSYGLYSIACVSSAGSTSSWYQIQAIKWAGGGKTRTPPSTPSVSANNCSYFQAGLSYTRSASRAVVWSNGANVGVSGVNASFSSQTGYAKESAISFKFNKSRYLCGTNDVITGTPRRLVAHT